MEINPYSPPATDVEPTSSGELRKSPYGPYFDNSGRGRALVILLSLGIAMSLVGNAYLMQLNSAMQSNDPEVAVSNLDLIGSVVTLGEIGLLLATIILWCMWIHRLCKNAWALMDNRTARSAPSDRITPGWAVGWYFVPFANYWMPYKTMCFIREVLGKQTSFGMTVGIWWSLYLASNIVSIAVVRGSNLATETIEGAIAYNERLMSSSLVDIVSAVAAIVLVRKMTKAQEATYSASVERDS